MAQSNGAEAPLGDPLAKQELNLHARAKLLRWLAELCAGLKFSRQTWHLAVHYVDGFLRTKHWPRDSWQILGQAALLVASKVQEVHAWDVEDAVWRADHSFTVEELLQCERELLTTLNWCMLPPTTVELLCARLATHHPQSRLWELLDAALLCWPTLPPSGLVAAALALDGVPCADQGTDQGALCEQLAPLYAHAQPSSLHRQTLLSRGLDKQVDQLIQQCLVR